MTPDQQSTKDHAPKVYDCPVTGGYCRRFRVLCVGGPLDDQFVTFHGENPHSWSSPVDGVAHRYEVTSELYRSTWPKDGPPRPPGDGEDAVAVWRGPDRGLSVEAAHDAAATAMDDATFALHQTDCAICEDFGRPGATT